MPLITERKAFKKAIPILATDARRSAKLLSSLSPVERKWAEGARFAGGANTFCTIPDDKGGIARVLAGVSDANDPWALAALPLELPPGRYELGKGPVVIAPDKAAFAWNLGAYQFTRYKKPLRQPAELQLEKSVRVAEALETADAVRLVRDMVNTPTEDMGPEHLSEIARWQAKHFGGKFREWVGGELLAENFPAIHAVGRAASRAPRLLEIHWGSRKHPLIAVVGKGVCFDTGGLNLKTKSLMRLQKIDMGGAAHAIALARLIMQRELPLRLHMLVPAVENAIGGNAYRPGDVIGTRKGLSVEIGNTDNEGRMILCDALAYAVEQRPKTIIDFTTLTDAAQIALGPELPALFCNDERLARRLKEAADAVHDPFGRLPLWRNYRRFFESEIADLNNSGRGQAGSIVAALFLDYFVPQDIAWAHFDAFCWNDVSRPGRPLGGEAQSLRAVLEALS